jgi:hypothetical protein
MVKLKVEQLRNIPIQQLVYSGSWMRMIANTKIELKHVENGIILLINDVLQPVRWQVYERRIRGDISHRGGFIPDDKSWVYYVWGNDRRRYRYLCLMSLPDGRFRIGTRHDFGAVYTSSCYSRRQRKIARECRLIRLTRRQRTSTRMGDNQPHAMRQIPLKTVVKIANMPTVYRKNARKPPWEVTSS